MIKVIWNHFSDSLSNMDQFPQQDFSASARRTFGAGSFLAAEAVLCVSGVFSSISGLYPLEASCIPSPSVVTTKNVSRHCQMTSEGPHHPWLKTTRDIQGLTK